MHDPAITQTSTPLPSIPPFAPSRPLFRWLRRLIILIVFGLFVWYAIDNFARWKDVFYPRKFREIVPAHLFVSGQINRRLLPDVITSHHINYIVSLCSDDPSDPDVAQEIATAREMKVQRFSFPLSGDGTGDIHSYADAIAQTARAIRQGQVVLLHCESGAQRSNGATFYYRVFVEGRSTKDAVAEMNRHFFDARRNTELLPYLNAHMQEMAELLLQRGVIDHIPSPLPHIDSHD